MSTSPPIAPARLVTITAESGLFSAPSSTEELVAQGILTRPTGAYTAHDIGEVIVPAYWRYAVSAGLDPVIVIAQAAYETDNFSSWWAARPRRNPAGIGVNGQRSVAKPDDPTGWVYNAPCDRWEHGCVFGSWEDEAIPAHVGRLLAYLLPPRTGSAMQRAIIDLALTFRPLEPVLRGSVKALRHLGQACNPTGKGWATPGKTYGRSIAAVAVRLARGG
jgi:hypothetical protein